MRRVIVAIFAGLVAYGLVRWLVSDLIRDLPFFTLRDAVGEAATVNEIKRVLYPALAILFSAIGVIVAAGVARRWKQPEPGVRRCGDCGYNLTGNTSGRCPECGAFA